MASQTKYHLLPEETGRPSMDSVSDDQPLIHPSRRTSLAPTTKDGPPQVVTLHITFLLRFLAFAFHLASFTVFAVHPRDYTIPAIVFLSFSYFRNFYVLLKHLVNLGFKITISWRMHGTEEKKYKFMSWLWAASSIVIDLSILLSLTIILPIGLVEARNNYYSGNEQVKAYIVAFVGYGFYLFGALDGGSPSNFAIDIAAAASFRAKLSKNYEEPSTPQMAFRDIEAQLPEEEEAGRSGEGDAVLL